MVTVEFCLYSTVLKRKGHIRRKEHKEKLKSKHEQKKARKKENTEVKKW